MKEAITIIVTAVVFFAAGWVYGMFSADAAQTPCPTIQTAPRALESQECTTDSECEDMFGGEV